MLAAAVAIALLTTAPVKKVLVIGIDGCRPDALLRADTPNIHALIADGCWAVGKTDPLAMSGPGWSTALCGVWANKHGVRDDSFQATNLKEYPDFLSLIERTKPQLRSVAVTQWKPLTDKLIAGADYEGPKRGAGDEVCVVETADLLLDTDPDVVFVQLGRIDVAGHAFGFGTDVPEYMRAIGETDTDVGVILTAMSHRKTFADEDWLVILVSDHGGSGKSHGQAIAEHVNVPFIVSGPSSADAITVVPTLCDVAPTVFAHLGLGVSDDIDWDGVPVGLKGVDSHALQNSRDAHTVMFDPPSGFYVGKTTVKISTGDPHIEVHVTSDGTPPTAKSLSANEVEIGSDVLFRARAYSNGRPAGPSSFAAYQVQSKPLEATKLQRTAVGLLYRVVEGEFSSLDEVNIAQSSRAGVAAVPSEKAGGRPVNFALRFDGYVQVLSDGVYQFGLVSDDGSRLTIDDRRVIAFDGRHSASMGTGYVWLKAGWHRIQVDYFQRDGDAKLALAFGLKGEEMKEAKSGDFRYDLKSDLAVSQRPY